MQKNKQNRLISVAQAISIKTTTTSHLKSLNTKMIQVWLWTGKKMWQG